MSRPVTCLGIPLLLVLSGLTACASTSPWQLEVALDAGEKLGGCATGNLIPDRDGTEIVAVASSGAIHVAWRSDAGGWQTQKA